MKEKVEPSAEELTSGRRIARNTLFNLAGQIAPLILVLFALPALVDQLGTERFGVLVFLWTILTVFGIADIGIGYVMTRMVATRLGSGDRSDIPDLFWTCMTLLGLVDLALGVAFYFSAPWLVGRVVIVPDVLKAETYLSLVVISFCLPFSIVATALRGLLEAYQQFVFRNIIMIANAALMFAGSVVIALFTSNVAFIALGLLMSRALIVALSFSLCLVAAPALRTIGLRPAFLRQIFNLGIWMTLSNIASPLLQYGDRFLISSLVSISAVGFYFIPYELANRLLITIGSLTTVLMPAFATSINRDDARAARLFELAIKVALITIVPPVFAVSTFAEPILSFWVGDEMARTSTALLQIICVGIVFSAVGIVAFSFVLGAGRPDGAAKLHVVELIIYLPFAAVLIARFGLTGAAAAMVIRVACDALLLLWFAKRLMRDPGTVSMKPLAFLAVAVIALAGLIAQAPLTWKISYAATAVTAYSAAAWFWLFSTAERKTLVWTLRSAVLGAHFRTDS